MREVVISKFFWNFLIFYCVFRVFATSTSSDIVSSFFSEVIFTLALCFSERKGFTVCPNFLLSVIFFSINFVNFVEFFKNLFQKCVLSMIDLDNVLVMKGLLFPRGYLFFLGTWWFNSLWHILKNKSGFLV